MDIISAFKEPTVLVTIFFGILFYLFPNEGKKLGDKILSIVSYLSKRIHKAIRIKKWQNKKHTLQTINSPYKMQWLIIRSFSYMILFFLFFISNVTFLSLLTIAKANNSSELLKIIISIPVLVFEFLWLTEWIKTKKIIDLHSKRVKSR